MKEGQDKNILGVSIRAVEPETALAAILGAAREKQALSATALAVHGLMCGFLDKGMRQRLNGLGMVLPDGQPVRWALNLLHGAGLRERVYGPDLMLALCARAQEQGLPVYLYGGRAKALSELEGALRKHFPGLAVAGTSPSLFRRMSPAEKNEAATRIIESGARLVFVGLGCPRQESWVEAFSPLLDMPLIAVGAAFDFLAGIKPQAPAWMQKRGLEWLFRLCCEPRRLWKRYLLLNPLYLLLVALQMLGLKFRAVAGGTRTEEQPWG